MQKKSKNKGSNRPKAGSRPKSVPASASKRNPLQKKAISFPRHYVLDDPLALDKLLEKERSALEINLTKYASMKTWTPFHISYFLRYIYTSRFSVDSENAFLNNFSDMLDYLEKGLPQAVSQTRPYVHARKNTFSITIPVNRKEKYILRSDLNFRSYITHWCVIRMRAVIKRNREQLRIHPGQYSRSEIFRLLDYCETLFHGQQPTVFRSREAFFEMFRKTVYSANSFPLENAYDTKAGEAVRSKNECFTADLLYDLGIPYLYEFPVHKENGPAAYPDFLILSPVNYRIYYIELFGRMNDPEYVSHTLQKIQNYASMGIHVGFNFLIIFEGETTPFNRKHFKSMLEATVLSL